ncbi:MAG: tetratricopeptide repeat protein [Candidatus Hinthialibacter sp.]
MSRFTLGIFFASAVVIVLSCTGFYYLSFRPNMMLWIEEYHPSNAYQRGRQLKEEGRLAEAIASIRSGLQYFEQMAGETRLKRHRLQYLQGFLELASVYREYGDPRSLEKALDCYSQAAEIDPYYAEGQPSLSKGMLLHDQRDYQEAAAAFTQVIDCGGSLTALEAALGRGSCFYEMKEYQKACPDWYNFARYKKGITLEQLKNLATLPVDSCTRALYIHARTALALGRKTQAAQSFEQYLSLCPEDRSARFYYRRLTSSPAPASEAAIPLADFYPHSHESPLPFFSKLVDLYANEAVRVELAFQFSLPPQRDQPAKCRVNLNAAPAADFIVHAPEPRRFSTQIDLAPGMNLLDLHVEQNPGDASVTSLLLHSLFVKPQPMN